MYNPALSDQQGSPHSGPFPLFGWEFRPVVTTGGRMPSRRLGDTASRRGGSDDGGSSRSSARRPVPTPSGSVVSPRRPRQVPAPASGAGDLAGVDGPDDPQHGREVLAGVVVGEHRRLQVRGP